MTAVSPHGPGYLLVYGQMGYGGIETLVVRLANYIAGQGKRVAVCTSGGPLLGNLEEGVQRLVFADEDEAIELAAGWLERTGPATTLSFDPISAALALEVELRAGPALAAAHLSGVFHPRAYFMTGERRDRIQLNRLVAEAVGNDCLFFMNEEMRDEHVRVLGVGQGSTIVPLPVAERPFQWTPGAGPGLRLVSIGRLVDFKAYALEIPAIVQFLKARGVEVHWDIYGDGPLKGEVEDRIARYGDPGIRLAGILPYEQFAETTSGYDLFVGMGTSALEAAMLGVPTIVATESRASSSHGYLHQLPFGNVGEQRPDLPAHELKELIDQFAAMTPEERSLLSARSRSTALRFSINHFLSSIDALAARKGAPAPRTRKRLAAGLYRLATRSAVIKLARRIRAMAA